MFWLSRSARIGCGATSRRIERLPSDKPILRLEDILENIARIERYTEPYNFERFAQDQQCQDAVERCLLRISEAAKSLRAWRTPSCRISRGRIFAPWATFFGTSTT